MKLNVKKLFTVLAIVFGFMPVIVQALDYEVGFKLYKFDKSTYDKVDKNMYIEADMLDQYPAGVADYWLKNVFQAGLAEEYPAQSELNPGDYLVVANTVKKVDNASASAFSLYYRYDVNVLEATDLPGVIDNRTALNKGAFTSDTWAIDVAAVQNGEISMTFRDTKLGSEKVFSNTKGMPITFTFLKVKDDATPGEEIAFKYITSVNSNGSSLITMGATPLADEVPVAVVNSEGLSVYQESDNNNNLGNIIGTGTIDGVEYAYEFVPVVENGVVKGYKTRVPAKLTSMNILATPQVNTVSMMSSDATGLTYNLETQEMSGSVAVDGSSFNITVTAQDGTPNTYEIKINRLSDVATLESLTLSSVPGFSFNKDTLMYNDLSVPYSTEKTGITATPSTGAKIVSGLESNEWNLTNHGSTLNTKSIVVHAQNCEAEYADVPGNACTSNTYTINVKRESPSNDATLKSVAVKIGSSTVNLSGTDFTDLTYDLGTVKNNINSIEVKATPNDEKASVIVSTNEDAIQIGDNTVTITVTAEDGTTNNVYKLKVKRLTAEESVSDLTGITIDGVALADFSTNKTSYSHAVASNVSNVTIGASATNGAKVTINSKVSNEEVVTINPGDNTVNIIVSDGDGSNPKSYTIDIRRKYDSSNMTNLTVSSSPASTITKNSSNDYTVDIPKGVSNITLTPVLDTGARVVTPASLTNIDVTGISSLTIEVAAEDENIPHSYYTVTLNKDESSDPVDPAGAPVKSVSVLGVAATWNEEKARYEVTVPSDNASVKPENVGIVLNTGVSLKEKDALKALAVGETLYTFTVTKDGKDEAYTVAINRAASNNSNIKNVTSSVGTVTKSGDNYKVTVPKGTTSLNIDVEPAFPNAIVTGDGDVTLPLADNKLQVSVQAEDGTIKMYDVLVEVQGDGTGEGEGGEGEGGDNPSTLDKITSTIHTIDNAYIRTVKENEKGIDVKNELTNENKYLEIWTSDESRKVLDDEVLATGMIVKLVIDGAVKDQKIIVIRGETTGDGIIDSFDAIKVVFHTLGTERLEGAYYEAAFVNEDEEIDSFDAMGIIFHTLGTAKLF